jgi:hypothetical protein
LCLSSAQGLYSPRCLVHARALFFHAGGVETGSFSAPEALNFVACGESALESAAGQL